MNNRREKITRATGFTLTISGALLLLYRSTNSLVQLTQTATQVTTKSSTGVPVRYISAGIVGMCIVVSILASQRQNQLATIGLQIFDWIDHVKHGFATVVFHPKNTIQNAVEAIQKAPATRSKTEALPTTPNDLTDSQSNLPVRSENYGDIVRYWYWVVKLTGEDENASTKTPTEIRERAVKQGLPREPISVLLQAFQAAQYGPKNLTIPNERIENAVQEIKDHTRSAQVDHA